VTFNYRLNAFGFLASDMLRSRSMDNATGNYGLLDQRAAMAWVQNNIEAFNGDPSRVMIFGESAGGGSVSNHMVMPNSWEFFQRAAIQSGPIAADWVTSPMSSAKVVFDQFVSNTGCVGPDVMSCLLSLSTNEIINASQLVSNGALLPWTPVVDGVELTALPAELAAQGLYNKVPVLLGTNKDEGTVFIGYLGVNVSAAEFAIWVKLSFPTLYQQVLDMYPLANYSSPYWAASAMWGDSQMTCPARRTARWLSDPRLNPVPVYLYYFTHAMDYMAQSDPYLGCFHGSDIYFVFHVVDPYLIGAGEPQLSDYFVQYWSNFASEGNPNGNLLAWWPAYDVEQDTSLDLDIPEPFVIENNRELQCDFWDSVQ